MPTWTHVYAAGDDIQDVAIWNMYLAALTERGLVLGLPTSISAGHDLQDLTIISTIQGLFDFAVGGASISSWSAAVHWIVYQDATGLTGDDSGTSSSVFFQLTLVDWNYTKATVLGGNGWTRKYPREFATLAAIAYTDGNPFVNGQFARCVLGGLVYQRVAGAWVAAPTSPPDVVSTFGHIQAGDYIGPWHLNELRDAIRLLKGFVVSGLYDVAARRNSVPPILQGPYGSWAAAQAGEGANYLASSGGVGQVSPSALTEGIESGGAYGAGVTRAIGRAFFANALPTVACQVECYVYGTTAAGTFDNSGDPMVNGSWNKFDTLSLAAATSGFSAYCGNLGVPNWCADPTGTGVTQFLGYSSLPHWLGIGRLDVVGGLVYV